VDQAATLAYAVLLFNAADDGTMRLLDPTGRVVYAPKQHSQK
jgi:hypothetical protein